MAKKKSGTDKSEENPMHNISLCFDGTDISGRDMLTAVRWMTDPLRGKVIQVRENIVRVVVFNSAFMVWNPVQHRRIQHLLERNRRIGGDVYASLAYDSIKGAMLVESYESIRRNLLVCPFELEESEVSEKISVDFDEELFYDKNNILSILNSYEENKEELESFSRKNESIEVHVKKVLDQVIVPRMTSNLLSTSDLNADILDLSEQFRSTSEELRDIRGDMLTREDLKEFTGNMLTKADVEELKNFLAEQLSKLDR